MYFLVLIKRALGLSESGQSFEAFGWRQFALPASQNRLDVVGFSVMKF